MSPAPEEMIPIWEYAPGVDPSSIAWRMGVGEAYKIKWCKFYDGLSEIEQARYKEKYPEPEEWKGFYDEE
jgi:hypothetical protein